MSSKMIASMTLGMICFFTSETVFLVYRTYGWVPAHNEGVVPVFLIVWLVYWVFYFLSTCIPSLTLYKELSTDLKEILKIGGCIFFVCGFVGLFFLFFCGVALDRFEYISHATTYSRNINGHEDCSVQSFAAFRLFEFNNSLGPYSCGLIRGEEYEGYPTTEFEGTLCPITLDIHSQNGTPSFSAPVKFWATKPWSQENIDCFGCTGLVYNEVSPHLLKDYIALAEDAYDIPHCEFPIMVTLFEDFDKKLNRQWRAFIVLFLIGNIGAFLYFLWLFLLTWFGSKPPRKARRADWSIGNCPAQTV